MQLFHERIFCKIPFTTFWKTTGKRGVIRANGAVGSCSEPPGRVREGWLSALPHSTNFLVITAKWSKLRPFPPLYSTNLLVGFTRKFRHLEQTSLGISHYLSLAMVTIIIPSLDLWQLYGVKYVFTSQSELSALTWEKIPSEYMPEPTWEHHIVKHYII